MSKFTIDDSMDSFKFGIKSKDQEHVFTAHYPSTKQVVALQKQVKAAQEKEDEEQIQSIVEAIATVIDEDNFIGIATGMTMRALTNLVQKIVEEISGEEPA